MARRSFLMQYACPGPGRSFTAKSAAETFGEPSDIDDRVLILQFVHDLTNHKLHVGTVSGVSQGSELSIEQILGDAFDEASQRLRVVDLGTGPSATESNKDETLVMQDVHDPGAHAIRIIKDTAADGTSVPMDWRTILNEVHDPVNHALKVVPKGAGGTQGTTLEPAHVFEDVYDPGVGLRVSL